MVNQSLTMMVIKVSTRTNDRSATATFFACQKHYENNEKILFALSLNLPWKTHNCDMFTITSLMSLSSTQQMTQQWSFVMPPNISECGKRKKMTFFIPPRMTESKSSSCFLSCYQPCDRARDYPFRSSSMLPHVVVSFSVLKTMGKWQWWAQDGAEK